MNRNDYDFDFDVFLEAAEAEEEGLSKDARKKIPDIDHGEECGDLSFTKEGATRKKKKTDIEDIELDDEDEDKDEDTEDDEDSDDDGDFAEDLDKKKSGKKKSSKKSSKKKKDDDEECDDDECDDKDDEKDSDDEGKDDEDDLDFEGESFGFELEAARRKRKKKVEDGEEVGFEGESARRIKKSKSIDFDEECGDGCIKNTNESVNPVGNTNNNDDEELGFEAEGFAKKIKNSAKKAGKKIKKEAKHWGKDLKDAGEDMLDGLVDLGEDIADEAKDIVDYAVEDPIGRVFEEQLQAERDVMTQYIDGLYKEYEMIEAGYGGEYEFVDEYESDEVPDDTEVVQEKWFGGIGHDVKKVVKPVAKIVKKVDDRKHNVQRFGLIRNTFARNADDLRGHSFLFKFLTWPFLLVKNLIQTIYFKIRNFVRYKSLLIGIEVKINKTISRVKRNIKNYPTQLSGRAAGYVAAAGISLATGKGLPLDPVQFIANEGAAFVDAIGQDTMIRGLTSRLSRAIENSPQAAKQALAEYKQSKGGKAKEGGSSDNGKISPDEARGVKPIITINGEKLTVNSLLNKPGIDKMLVDIGEFGKLAEDLCRSMRGGQEEDAKSCLARAKKFEKMYIKGDQVNASVIYSKKGGGVTITTFYDEISSKLKERAGQLEEAMHNLDTLNKEIKSNKVQVSAKTEKRLVEIQKSMQHTANAFTELINSLDDLGAYVVDTMNTYVKCLNVGVAALEKMSKQKPGKEPKEKKGLFHKKKKGISNDISEDAGVTETSDISEDGE